MNTRSLRTLELDKVLASLDERIACTLGSDLVAALQPATSVIEVQQRLAQTTEARLFTHTLRAPTFGGITDIKPILHRAGIGALLDPASLLATAAFAAGARRLRDQIVAADGADFTWLRRQAQDITPKPALEKAISEAIDSESQTIRDEASLDLLKARRNIGQMKTAIQSRLRQMLADRNVQPFLQDLFVTVRDGRYCLPVRADSRARVPGIVHDRSGSGGAYFVEPQAVVELNNQLRELHAKESEAIQAILSDLSSQVAAAADDLLPAVAACGRLDFAFAKGALSVAMDARAVPVAAANEEPASLLLQARHPLVAKCIANDIALGDQFDILLITGPNTGGKTVVLKTLGLLVLMVCCGLHIPVAQGSHVAIPGEVFADIGDEQSIEQSLSTFSSHVKNIIHILSTAKTGDLVLLDEVGAGTDPDEGAALAKAVLRALQRRGAQVIATTHYGELKQFALSARRFENASVEFDIATLAPTYHLRIGIPGASNALDIANRLGMPAELVLRARRYLGRERAEAEEATQRLEETQRQLTAHTRSAERERDEIEVLRRDYENRLASVHRDADLKIAIAQRDARELLRTTRQEADSILRDLRNAPRESKQTEEARDRLRALTTRVGGLGRSHRVAEGVGGTTAFSSRALPSAELAAAAEETETTDTAEAPASQSQKVATPVARRPLRSRRDSAGSPETTDFQPRIGDLVHVKTIDREGELLHIGSGGDRVEVRVGAIRLQLPRTQIAALRNTDRTVGGVSAIRVRKAFTVPDEINLIGHSTDEAMPLVEKYLDDAILAEVKQIRIVHGRGSGVLRKAIHARLKNHPGITDFATAPPEQGGDGATIVNL